MVPKLRGTLPFTVFVAKENSSWGVSLNSGERLSNLGDGLGRGTIAEILIRHGMEPAPERERKNHLEGVPEATLGPDYGRRFFHYRVGCG